MERFIMNGYKMEKKEEKTILKKWAKVNGNGNNGNGDNNFHSSTIMMYKTPRSGAKLSFSIGDTWTEIIDGIACLYKVLSTEDVIIPAGKYRCFKVSEEIEGGIRNHYWFASSVGLVKWQVGEIKGVLQDCIL